MAQGYYLDPSASTGTLNSLHDSVMSGMSGNINDKGTYTAYEWRGDAYDTLRQGTLLQCLGNSTDLIATSLAGCETVPDATTVTEMCIGLEDGIPAGLRSVVAAAPRLGCGMKNQHIAILCLVLAKYDNLREPLPEDLQSPNLRERTYWLWRKPFWNELDAAVDGYLVHQPTESLAMLKQRELADQYRQGKGNTQGRIMDGLVRCFLQARLDPGCVAQSDIKRVAKAIVGTLTQTWVDWKDDELFGGPNWLAEQVQGLRL